MTHTVAYLAIPKAAWDFIADAMEQAGYVDHMITEIDGRLTVAVPLDGIAVVPMGDQDAFVNSDRLTELMFKLGEDAFMAGHRAAIRGTQSADDAWDLYVASDHVLNLREKL